ncbi:MAG: head GIN domain-containing protein [Rhodothalassiaceae bacterium]
MRLPLLLLSAAVLAGPALADQETRSLEAFKEIKISGSMDADVRLGDTHRITIEADRETLARIETEVRDGVLHVKERDRRGWGRRGSVDLAIVTQALDGVTLSGSGDVTARNIDTDAFHLRISGSGDGDLAGRCGTLKIVVSGSGDVDASGLECDDVDVSISGSGDAEVYARRDVSVRVSGSGDVDIYGGGRLTNSKVSGSGDVAIHN